MPVPLPLIAYYFVCGLLASYTVFRLSPTLIEHGVPIFRHSVDTIRTARLSQPLRRLIEPTYESTPVKADMPMIASIPILCVFGILSMLLFKVTWVFVCFFPSAVYRAIRAVRATPIALVYAVRAITLTIVRFRRALALLLLAGVAAMVMLASDTNQTYLYPWPFFLVLAVLALLKLVMLVRRRCAALHAIRLIEAALGIPPVPNISLRHLPRLVFSTCARVVIAIPHLVCVVLSSVFSCAAFTFRSVMHVICTILSCAALTIRSAGYDTPNFLMAAFSLGVNLYQRRWPVVSSFLLEGTLISWAFFCCISPPCQLVLQSMGIDTTRSWLSWHNRPFKAGFPHHLVIDIVSAGLHYAFPDVYIPRVHADSWRLPPTILVPCACGRQPLPATTSSNPFSTFLNNILPECTCLSPPAAPMYLISSATPHLPLYDILLRDSPPATSPPSFPASDSTEAVPSSPSPSSEASSPESGAVNQRSFSRRSLQEVPLNPRILSPITEVSSVASSSQPGSPSSSGTSSASPSPLRRQVNPLTARPAQASSASFSARISKFLAAQGSAHDDGFQSNRAISDSRSDTRTSAILAPVPSLDHGGLLPAWEEQEAAPAVGFDVTRVQFERPCRLDCADVYCGGECTV
ncbi:hypothetical protein B0H11DRAFT_2294858 [Mycena galericulata]|nr:hypothetical protein B0H11DRAFT_2294858 [Mycena galericulata]